MCSKNSIDKQTIILDCTKAMMPALIIDIFGEALNMLTNMYAANVLGSFFDAVIHFDVKMGNIDFCSIIVCCIVLVLIVPFVKMCGEIVMFRNSLSHDEICQRRYISKTYQSTRKLTAGEIQKRLEDDPINLRIDWIEFIQQLVLIPVVLTILLIQSLRINVLYSFVMLGVLMVKLVFPFLTKHKSAQYDLKEREYNTAMRSYEEELIKSPSQTELLGLTAPFVKRIQLYFKNYYLETGRKAIWYFDFSKGIEWYLNTFCSLCIIFFGAWLTSRSYIQAGSVLTMLAYFSIYETVVQYIKSLILVIPKLRNDISRMQIFYADRELIKGKDVSQINHIILRDLSFFYDKEKKAFGPLNFEIYQGDKIAIIGANGTGKSTLLRLLCGLYTDYQGTVFVNTDDLRNINPHSWRKMLAVVPQNPFLFYGSVIENIKLGNRNASDSEILGVMSKLKIDYLKDRCVQHNNNALSGGEMQKISIARAIIKDSPLLILDEPDNHLDKQMIEWLKKYIEHSSKTIIMVTHSKELIKTADKSLHL